MSIEDGKGVANNPLGGLSPSDSVLGDSSKPTEVGMYGRDGYRLRGMEPDTEPRSPRSSVYSERGDVLIDLPLIEMKVMEVDGVDEGSTNFTRDESVPVGEIWVDKNLNHTDKKNRILKELVEAFLTIKENYDYDSAARVSKSFLSALDALDKEDNVR